MIDITIRISGESGEGIVSAGDILGKVFSRCNLQLNSFKTYPPAMRSGHVSYQLRVRDTEVSSQKEMFDLLVAFDKDAYNKNKDLAAEKSLVVLNDSEYSAEHLNIAFEDIAKKEIGSVRAKNIVALGIIAAICDIPLALFKDVVREKFAKKGEKVLESNMAALGKGFDSVPCSHRDFFRIKPSGVYTEQLILSGNDAVAMGAITAGLKIYAGYPITPATDIMEFLFKELPRYGGHCIQTEDEIAALGMVLGAAFVGENAMTATSGPGLSLMSELIGLANIAELPVVIIDVQRGGPSTGMPTRVEQGDLNQALYGTHGEAANIVLAPTNVADCFYQTINAFILAKRFQVPVLLLSDLTLGQRKETIVKPEWKGLSEEMWRARSSSEWHDYKRYKFTESGISPMSIPGEKGGYYVAQGLEHDEKSVPCDTPENRRKMIKKRMRKLEGVEAFLEMFMEAQSEKTGTSARWEVVSRFGHEEPEMGIIGWGSSEGVVKEAVLKANAMGLKIAGLYPRLLCPLPEQKIEEFLKPLKKVIVPELNATGQLAGLLASKFNIPMIKLNKATGEPFYTEDIMKAIKEIYLELEHDSVRV